MTKSKPVIGTRKAVEAASGSTSLLEALLLAHPMVKGNGAHFTHFDGLSTELRISEAVFDLSSGDLEVRGWCLTPQAKFRIFIEVREAGLVTPVTPNTEERTDLQEKYPQYANPSGGWRVTIRIGSLPKDAIVRAVYLGRGRHTTVEARVKFRQEHPATDTATEPAAAIAAADVLCVEKGSYSPLRGLCLIEGTLVSDRDDVRIEARLASGSRTARQSFRISAADDNGVRRWKLNFPVAGMIDRETAIVSVAGDPEGGQRIAITERNDSPRRTRALTASAVQESALLADSLNVSDLAILCDLPEVDPPTRKSSGEACYFPPFETLADVSAHFHRAMWYLSGTDSPLERVMLHSPFGREDLAAPAGHMMDACPADHRISIVADREGYLQALQRAEAVIVWRPLPAAVAALLGELLGKPLILTVATDDPSAREFRNYGRLPWLLLSEARKAALLLESRQRFRDAIGEQRRQGKTCSAVLGTGPSLDRAFAFDFGDCMSVACNSIVASPALLDHIRPAFICAGDAVSHFGVSKYAQAFREDLNRALLDRGIFFLTTAEIGFQLYLKYPEIRDRVILCEQGFSGLNADLGNVWSLPRFDSTLNIHMQPIAASFSDTVYMLGLDGRSPDPAQNEDFWAHSQAAHYHDLVATGHLAHPTFAISRAQATEERYLASVQESFLAGECIGKSFLSLADSFTPAVHARPAPAACLAADGTEGRRKLRAVGGIGNGTAARRALVVSHIAGDEMSDLHYHATILAEAMAGFCDEVVLWATDMPPWLAAFCLLPDHVKVRVHVNDFLEPPEGHFDHVVLVPDSPGNPEMLVMALEKAQACNARVALVSVATPNLINARTPALKPLREADVAFAAACFSDIVLSASETAVPFAESHFRTLFHRPRFMVALPAINDAAADEVKARKLARGKQILVMLPGGGSLLPGSTGVLRDLVTPEMAGYTLAVARRTSGGPQDRMPAGLREHLEGLGIGFRLVHLASDRARFEEIARSELVVFPALSEEIGYPLAEAGYMGTPCVAYDLPVLTELDRDQAHLVPFGDAKALRDSIAHLLRMPPESRLRTSAPAVLQTAGIRQLREALQTIFGSASDAPVARCFSPEKFEVARKVYLDGCNGPVPSLNDPGRANLQEILSVLEDLIAGMAAPPAPPVQNEAG